MRTQCKLQPRLGLLLTLVVLTLHVAATAAGEQQVLNDSPHAGLRLRNATINDAAAIANVTIAAFFDLPNWDYLYQFRREYPREHQRCMTQFTNRILAHPAGRGEVVEIEAGADGERVVIASALWLQLQLQCALAEAGGEEPIPVGALSEGELVGKGLVPSNRAKSRAGTEMANCTHRDLNLTRAVAWDHQWNTLARKNLAPFGGNQLYLELLGTHPAYQGRGAGSSLVKSGLERARKEMEEGELDVNVTLIAQPTAETFYMGMGFKEMRNMTMEGVDGESFVFNVMAYDMQSED
ncbi:acetyltransferase [Paraphaeosphaeria sporulosa]